MYYRYLCWEQDNQDKVFSRVSFACNNSFYMQDRGLVANVLIYVIPHAVGSDQQVWQGQDRQTPRKMTTIVSIKSKSSLTQGLQNIVRSKYMNGCVPRDSLNHSLKFSLKIEIVNQFHLFQICRHLVYLDHLDYVFLFSIALNSGGLLDSLAIFPAWHPKLKVIIQ